MGKYILFLILILNLFNNNLYAQKKTVPLIQDNKVYTFDYSKPESDQNDCWDVNSALAWGGIADINAPLAKESLCRGLVFYSDANTGCNSDPVCEYYKDKYGPDKKNIDENLSKAESSNDTLYKKDAAVKACQWLDLGKITEKVLENGTEKIKEKEKGVCVPRSDFYIAGYIQVPDEYSQYMRKDGVYMGTKNSYERDADINRINALNEKMQKANLETVQPKATKNVNVFSSESISPEHKKIIDNFNYLLEQKDSFLIKSLGLSDTTDLKSIKITSRVDSFDCGFFRSKDKKYTKAIIDSISNAQRDTNAKYCSIAVVYATVGEGEEKTNHLFIYNDLYASFIPITINDALFTISDEIPETRYNSFCTDGKLVNNIIWPDDPTIKDVITGQAVLGFYGPNKDNAASKSINGSITTFDKLVAIAKYCPQKFNNMQIEDRNYMTFVKNFSEKYKTYYEDKTKTNKDFPGLLARLSRLEEPTYTESYFFKFVKAALPENTNTTGFNKVYADEVKSVFKMKAFTTSEIKSNMFMGLPVFFYALADHIGFGITPESKLLPEKWVLANEISATSPLIKLNMNNINTIGRFIIPSLYAEGIGAPITSADNVYYFVTKDGLQTGYNQANSVSAFSSNYLSSLSTINAALNHPTDYLNDAALGNNYTPNTPKEKKARGGGFGRWLSSDATSKLGILALSYYMQSQQAKLDSARLKAQLELQEITARANQCSSMDCNYQKDLCLMQQVPCRTNREIIFGWTWGKKDDLCYLRDIDISSLDTSSEQYKTYQKCITCDPIYTNTQAYTNPYSGQSEQMTLYQICLMNVTSSLLNRNKCFDLINVNAQSPGLVSNSDIRNCFTGLTPTRNNSSINYIPPTITPTTPAATTPETKKKDAAGTGTPAGGGSPSAPGSGVENKAAPKPDDSVYGKYKNTNTDAPRFNQGSGYYGGSGGSSGTGSDVKSSGLTAPVPSSTPAELTIKAMMEEQIRDMRSKLGATE